MNKLFLLLFLLIAGPCFAYLTAGKVAVTATSSSSGVSSTSQDSDISDAVGTSVSVAVPVTVTGNVNISGVYQVNGTPISATSNWSQNGSTINYIAGNVGINTVTPGQTLDVQGTVRVYGAIGVGASPAFSMDVQGTIRGTAFTGQGGHGLFGSWVTVNEGQTYLATTDGTLCAVGAGNDDGGVLKTDSSNNPQTIRAIFPSISGQTTGTCCPVRKGDYYLETGSSGDSVYFLGLGS